MSDVANATAHVRDSAWIEHNLPTGLCEVLAQARRVVLIANNPAISQQDLDPLALDERDVLVSFNTCVKSDLLSERTANLFVHGYHGQDHYFFGLPPGERVAALFAEQPQRCFTLLVGVVNPMSALPNVAVFEDRIPLAPLLDYPQHREKGKLFAGPSTGFNAMVLLDWLRSRPGYGFELYAVGFSNEAGKLWGGHAWSYERNWLAQSSVRMVTLQVQPQGWRARLSRLFGR